MMMGVEMVRPLALASVALFAAGCTTAAPPELAELKPIGPAQMCLQLQNIRNTRVLDDQTIDFIMRNGDVFRNRLPNSCPQLGFQQSFTYATSITQLCSVDIITVLIQGQPGLRGASCGLGPFTPIARPVRGSGSDAEAAEALEAPVPKN
jgi:hypothetical protein